MPLPSKIVELDSTFTLVRKSLIRQQTPLAMFTPYGLRFTNVEPNPKAMSLFKEMFGCNELPVSYMFIQAFRYMGQVLITSKIPSKLMGMIHLTSQFNIVQKHDWLKPTEIDVRIISCVESDKGLIYSLTTHFYQLGQLTLVNENQFLDKNPGYQSSKGKKIEALKPNVNIITKAYFSQRLARQYAKVSGDYNPIHIHPLLAKLFGMKSSVMHGMYGLHWMLTNNEMLATKATGDFSFQKTVIVDFNRPCYLPKTVLLTENLDEQSYALYSEGLEDRFMKLNIT